MAFAAPALAEFPDEGKLQDNRYNVLFIAIDDLNDWVGCPTRTALLTRKRPSSTGVYGNTQNLKNAAKAKDVVTLPEYFGKHGYHTLSAGKIFHKHETAAGVDEGQWAFQEHAHPGGGNQGMLWQETPPSVDGIQAGGTDFAWGACKAPVEKTKDYVACQWASDQLQRDFDGKPFFLALGISKPHLPWYVPQQFFDLYPLEEIKPVEFLRTDLDDIVRNDGKRIFNPDARFELADKANLHKQAQRAYLANISYVDFCLGLVFDTLEKSKYAENELSSMTRQCTGGRRIGELEILKREIAAWSADANHTQRGVDWQMKIDDARYKLTSVYPKILT